MNEGFTYQGVSGALYHFAQLDMSDAKNVPWTAGIFVMASYAPEPIYIGQGENIYAEFIGTPMWPLAQQKHGANQVYIRLVKDVQKRQEVWKDLVENYEPPMNDPL